MSVALNLCITRLLMDSFFQVEWLGWEHCHFCSADSYSCKMLPGVRGRGALFCLLSQVLLCLKPLQFIVTYRQFPQKMCHFSKRFCVLRLLLCFAELFALIWGYKNGCAMGLLKFCLHPEKYFSDFTFQLRNVFWCLLKKRDLWTVVADLKLRAVFTCFWIT